LRRYEQIDGASNWIPLDASGVAVPAGIISTTGIAGRTLSIRRDCSGIGEADFLGKILDKAIDQHLIAWWKLR
jgi:hypothetical protein